MIDTNIYDVPNISKQVQALVNNLPNGKYTRAKNIDDSNLRNLMAGLAVSFFRIETLAKEIVINTNPRYAELLISEWETAVGIPCDCFEVADTLEERRKNVLIKINSLNLQTAEDFVELAELFGFEVDVEAGAVYGIYPATYPIMYSSTAKETRFTIIVTYRNKEDNDYEFPLVFPIPFSSPRGTDIMQCLFNKLKPANCQIVYRYRSD